ncbi:hypothetical protein PR048_017130, partial [Dryococelus australis]
MSPVCTSGVVQKCFESRYSCARTKTGTFVTNVFSPYSMSELRNDQSKLRYVLVFTNSSNHKPTKLFTLLVYYILPHSGVHWLLSPPTHSKHRLRLNLMVELSVCLHTTQTVILVVGPSVAQVTFTQNCTRISQEADCRCWLCASCIANNTTQIAMDCLQFSLKS